MNGKGRQGRAIEHRAKHYLRTIEVKKRPKIARWWWCGGAVVQEYESTPYLRELLISRAQSLHTCIPSQMSD